MQIRRIGHSVGSGLYPCLVREEAADPDPSLAYNAAYILTGEDLQINCNSRLHAEPDQTGTTRIHCFLPCAATEEHYTKDLIVIVTGRDDNQVTTGATAAITFMSKLRYMH